MKAVTFLVGVAAGMALATAGVITAYPDLSRRMSKDTRRISRCTRRMLGL